MEVWNLFTFPLQTSFVELELFCLFFEMLRFSELVGLACRYQTILLHVGTYGQLRIENYGVQLNSSETMATY